MEPGPAPTAPSRKNLSGGIKPCWKLLSAAESFLRITDLCRAALPFFADRTAIVEGTDFFHGYQAAGDHAVQYWEEALDLFFAVDDLDDHGQVHREAENF